MKGHQGGDIEAYRYTIAEVDSVFEALSFYKRCFCNSFSYGKNWFLCVCGDRFCFL